MRSDPTPNPTPSARVCVICGALFVPELPSFKTCSMACCTARVEAALNELARSLAGEPELCAFCDDPRESHDVLPEGACRECSCIAFVSAGEETKK